jgi:hypothetical protein
MKNDVEDIPVIYLVYVLLAIGVIMGIAAAASFASKRAIIVSGCRVFIEFRIGQVRQWL